MMDDCRLIDLPQIHDPRGNLTFIEGHDHVPFDIRRIYYLYDVPGGAERGGHAHKRLHQFFVAVSGSFDVHLDDGTTRKTFHLNRAHFGLYVCPMTWRHIDNFSGSSVCLVLASEIYREEDYFRRYEDFAAAISLPV
jgi:hypothetical protein